MATAVMAPTFVSAKDGGVWSGSRRSCSAPGKERRLALRRRLNGPQNRPACHGEQITRFRSENQLLINVTVLTDVSYGARSCFNVFLKSLPKSRVIGYDRDKKNSVTLSP
jgi:hypothetical protein